MKLFPLTLAFFFSLSCFGQKSDLVIKNANVFNARTGTLKANQTILIKDGLITKITGDQLRYAAISTIDAGGKLITPGFVDTHIHPTDIYRSYGALSGYLPEDSFDVY